MQIIRKRIIAITGFILGFLCINAMLTFVLKPYKGASELMWSDYHKEVKLDMVFVGSSVVRQGFNPYIVEEETGLKAYNMGTSSQSLNRSYIAIKTAIEEHPIQRVILGMEYSAMSKEQSKDLEALFLQAKNYGEPIDKQLQTSLEFMLNEENIDTVYSLNYLFPWIYNHVLPMSPDSIINNVKKKINNCDKESGYVGKGFVGLDGELDYNTVGGNFTRLLYPEEFTEESYEWLDKICSLCKANEVELIVINTPRPVYDVISYGKEYFDRMNELEQFLGEREVEYYDFNLAKPELFESKESYFIDSEHMNRTGADTFSKSFSKFLLLSGEGYDIKKKCFYSVEEYMDSINHISSVYFEVEQENQELNICAEAFCGTQILAEYEIEIYEEKSGECIKKRAYDKESSWEYKVDKPGDYIIRVNARVHGSEKEFEKYCERTVIVE